MPTVSRRALTLALGALLLLSVTSCVTVPLRGHQQYRRDQYLSTRRELSPTIASALESGHVVPGMDREQVWVVVGDPVRKSLFSAGTVEVWLVPSGRFHQDAVNSHGASSFRLVFVDGILRVIEPI